MREVISDTITIPANELPPKKEFIEKSIEKLGYIPIRWAITEVEGNNLQISFSGIKIK